MFSLNYLLMTVEVPRAAMAVAVRTEHRFAVAMTEQNANPLFIIGLSPHAHHELCDHVPCPIAPINPVKLEMLHVLIMGCTTLLKPSNVKETMFWLCETGMKA